MLNTTPRTTAYFVACLLWLLLPLLEKAQANNTVVFVNGNIYTVNEAQPWVDSIAIRDGIITSLGKESKVIKQAGQGARIIDLKGKMMMPGFQDPHLHVLEAGVNQNLCYLPAEASLSSYKRKIRACAKQQADEKWVRGAGVQMSSLLNRKQLPIDVLDQAVGDRPVMILDDIGHGVWVNTRALKEVGYDQRRDVPGGIVDRDPASGRATGLLFENAQQKIRTASFPATSKNLDFAYDSFLQVLPVLASNGITSVSDAGGYWSRGHHKVWQRAAREGTLTVRASNALYVYPDKLFNQQITQLTNLYSNKVGSLLRFNQVKIYVDGILSQGTGALYRPYDKLVSLATGSQKGFLYFQPKLLNRYASTLEKAGFQLHLHTTGDRAAGLALDAIEQAHKLNRMSDQRHRITHLYLVDRSDRARFKQLGVIADFQLAPSATDSYYIDYIAEYIGDRAKQLLPAKALLNAGATLTLSSDWDADTLSPMVKIYSVLMREQESVWDLATIIRMMTINVAFLLHQEAETGSLEVGKLADVIVLDRNLFDIAVKRIPKTKVLLTLLAGKPVYDKMGLFK